MSVLQDKQPFLINFALINKQCLVIRALEQVTWSQVCQWWLSLSLPVVLWVIVWNVPSQASLKSRERREEWRSPMHQPGTLPKEIAGILSATVSQAAKLVVPFRTPTRQFHSSCRVWEELQRKPQLPHVRHEYRISRPLIKRNPTKIVAIIWLMLAPVAISAFFYTKNYLERKRLRIMKLQRKRNAASQGD